MLINRLPDFGSARVLIVGDLMVDEFIYGSCERVSPEAPVPVVLTQKRELRPGGAANVASNQAALGVQVTLLGVSQTDSAGAWLRENLEQQRIRCEFIPSQQPTIRKTRVLSRNQQLLRIDDEQRYRGHEQQLLAKLQDLLPQHDLLVISDYHKGTVSNSRELIACARRCGKRVLVDPKRGFANYQGAWLLSPNMAELALASGRQFSDEADMLAAARALMAEHRIDNILLTRSEQGMSLLSASGEINHLPTRARDVYDVTGAGDTVIAVLAAVLAVGVELVPAAEIANVAAGIVVAKVGTASASLEEIELALSQSESELAVVDADTLAVLMRDARRRGERVVFTNGCFDIVHAGHVHYLQQARSLGDRLIVAVNDDASVRRLKGEGRPVNALGQRMSVLAALRAVDWVVAFADDTPKPLLQRLQPDILVKGGDYRDVDEVVGHEIVLGYGGEVRTLDQVDGVSTTAILAAGARVSA